MAAPGENIARSGACQGHPRLDYAAGESRIGHDD